MHGLKSTIALLIVLIGLGGYIYFVDSKRTEDPNAKPKVYTSLATDSIEELQIRNASGESMRVQRVGGTWEMVEPVKAHADGGSVDSVTGGLGSLEAQRVLEENPSDLKQYGLSPARMEIAFRLKGQKDFQRLLIGDKTPTGGDLYAKRADEKRVILVGSFLDSTFNKTAFDLRDKTILKFDREKADHLEIVNTAGTMQFARNGTDWRILKPVAARADYPVIEGILARLSSLSMLKLISESGELAKYGLDRPTSVVTVETGGARVSLLVGGKTADNEYYAKDANRPTVFTVGQALGDDIGKGIAEFRRKDLFDSRSFTASRLELQRPGGVTVVEKTEAGGKTTWKNGAGQAVDTAKVEAALTQLSNLRATSFDAAVHPSLKMPSLTAVVLFDKSKTETVAFGRSGNDVYARRSDEPGSMHLDAAVFEEAMKAVDALK